jgi:hypothetical protein
MQVTLGQGWVAPNLGAIVLPASDAGYSSVCESLKAPALVSFSRFSLFDD